MGAPEKSARLARFPYFCLETAWRPGLDFEGIVAGWKTQLTEKNSEEMVKMNY
jgi:hypothetical protein